MFTFALVKQNNGAIAQLVEQRTENPCVPGSIPGGTTLKSESCRNATLFLFGVKRAKNRVCFTQCFTHEHNYRGRMFQVQASQKQ